MNGSRHASYVLEGVPSIQGYKGEQQQASCMIEAVKGTIL